MNKKIEEEIKEIRKNKNYDYEANGYKFLGWQNGWEHKYLDENGNVTEDMSKVKTFDYMDDKYKEYRYCRDHKHFYVDIQNNSIGSENTVSCPICKIYYKYDCSD